MPDWPDMIALLLTGLLGGMLGGLLGIGGSVLFIPMMTEVLGADMHTAIAAALVINVCVGLSSTLGHRGSGRIMPHLLMVLVPASMVAAVVGVEVGGRFTGEMEVWLRRVFGAFMVYIIGFTIYRLFRPLSADDSAPGNVVGKHPSRVSIALVGGLKGFASGLLGIGGGSVAVPTLQMFCRLRLRAAIANSAAALFFSCLVAAIVKHLSATGGMDPKRAWVYVGFVAPTAVIGAYAGSRWAHRVGRVWIRLVFVSFLGWVAYRMLLEA